MSTDIAMGQAFDQAVNDLNNLISRRFAADRSIRIDGTKDGRWIAVTSDGDTLFPATPHLDTVIRFVRAFAEKEGVRVDEESVEYARAERAFAPAMAAALAYADLLTDPYSRRVPDNVVPISGR